MEYSSVFRRCIVYSHFLAICITLPFTLVSCDVAADDGPQLRPWPDGKIRYAYADSFSKRETGVIEEAMRIWEQAGITFVYTAQPAPGILSIRKTPRFSPRSEASCTGFDQDAYILLGGVNRLIVLHELGHIIGLTHEHQRPDRDEYISMIWENVESWRDYVVLSDDFFLYDYREFPYDLYSIMHYAPTWGAARGKKAFEVRDQDAGMIGGFLPDTMDFEKVRLLYGFGRNADF